MLAPPTPGSPPAAPTPPPPAGAPKLAPSSPSTSPSPAPSEPSDPSGSQVSASTLPDVGARPALTTRPKAGEPLVARVAFVNVKSKTRLTKGSVRCRALVANKRLRVLTNVFEKGYATCAWRVPKGAKGKQLTGIVAVQVGDKAARRLFFRQVT